MSLKQLIFLLFIFCIPSSYAAKTANRCYNPATKSTIFSDTPCETNGYQPQGTTNTPAAGDSNNNSQSHQSIYSNNRIMNDNDRRQEKSIGTISNSSKKNKCNMLRQQIDQAEASKNRADSSDYKYQWNKEDCAFVGK